MKQIAKIFIPLFLILGTLFSCSSDDSKGSTETDDNTPPPVERAITLQSSRNSSTLDENVTFVFTVKNEKGEDITKDASFKINDATHATKEFTPTELGEYKVISTFDGLTSNAVTITVTELPVVENRYYAHKVLVEDFTGAGCGWCPRVSKGIELAEADNNKIIAVAIHNTVFGPDPYSFAGRQVLESSLGVNAYPTAFINRSTKWRPEENVNYKMPSTFLNTNSAIGIKMSSDITATTGSVSITFTFKETFQDLKYIAYLVEDGLVYKQTNKLHKPVRGWRNTY